MTNLQKSSSNNLKLVLHTTGFCERRYCKLVCALVSNIHTNYPLLGRDAISRFFFKTPNVNILEDLRLFLPCCKCDIQPKILPSHFITEGTVADVVWEQLIWHSHSATFSFSSPAFFFSRAQASPHQSSSNIEYCKDLRAQWLWAPWASFSVTQPGQTCYSRKGENTDPPKTRIEWVLSATGPKLQGCL